MPRWVPAVAVVAGILAVIVLSDHSRETKTPEGNYVIADEASYQADLTEANKLSTQALQDFQAGKPLSPQETTDVKKAAEMLDEASYFKPKNVSPCILSGIAHEALGENEKAIEKLQQGIANISDDKSEALFQAKMNACYELSRAYFATGEYQKAYDQATLAAKAFPTSPQYLTQRAKAALQTNHADIAKEELSAALAIDPSYGPAKLLSKYLQGAKKS